MRTGSLAIGTWDARGLRGWSQATLLYYDFQGKRSTDDSSVDRWRMIVQKLATGLRGLHDA